MSLRYGASIEPRPTCRLSGWFERRGFWTVRRWLELDGSTLSYRRSQNAPVEWTCDLRECSMSAGRAPTEIIIRRRGLGEFSLFALSVTELKVWFAEMKRVSDSVYDFYLICAKIGHGPYGSVHLGRDRHSGRCVAVTVEEKASLPLHKMLLLTKRDLSIVSATQTHPNIVRVDDLFESTERFYIVSEFNSGGSLLSKFQEKQLPLQIVRHLITDILQALAHLHALDIVHGAVDMHHVVCTRRQLPCPVKLITYGSAVARRDARLLGEAGPGAAPEVVCFERRTPSSDVFAVGVLLFELLTGRHPFPAHHEAEYLSLVSKGVELSEISKNCWEVVNAVLADDASARPSALDCLQFKWFFDGVSEADAGFDEFGRLASDPKTVITEFTNPQAVGSPVSKAGLSESSGMEYGSEL